jgi:hypothetical protein
MLIATLTHMMEINCHVFEVKDICKTNWYRPEDLIYCKLPEMSLDQGLRLLSSNHDIIEMVSYYVGHGVVKLYIVTYGILDIEEEDADADAEEDSEYEREVVFKKDDF